MNNQKGIQSDGTFAGTVSRAHHPECAWNPLSDEGAIRNGGRFNRKGTPTLFTSLTILGALKEATPYGLQLQPTTLCTYEVDVRPVFDATNSANLAREGLSFADLSSRTWRAESFAGETQVTQSFAERLIHAGYAGILVPSFAYKASQSDLNLVLWRFGTELPTQATLMADDGSVSSPIGDSAQSTKNTTTDKGRCGIEKWRPCLVSVENARCAEE